MEAFSMIWVEGQEASGKTYSDYASAKIEAGRQLLATPGSHTVWILQAVWKGHKIELVEWEE